MGRRLALLVLVITTFMTALIGHAFAKPDAVRMGELLGSAPTELLEVPSHLGGGTRECYLVRGSFESVVRKVRIELTAKGWKEIAVRTEPSHTLFVDGFREVQVLQGKVRGGSSLETAQTRLDARNFSWEPMQEWVSVVFDAPSTAPLDRTRGVLHDLLHVLPTR